MFENKEKKIYKAGDEIVIQRVEDAEIPYELVKRFDANGNGRLYTRNIRDGKSELERKNNILALKKKEYDDAVKIAEDAKRKLEQKSERTEKVVKND